MRLTARSLQGGVGGVTRSAVSLIQRLHLTLAGEIENTLHSTACFTFVRIMLCHLFSVCTAMCLHCSPSSEVFGPTACASDRAGYKHTVLMWSGVLKFVTGSQTLATHTQTHTHTHTHTHKHCLDLPLSLENPNMHKKRKSACIIQYVYRMSLLLSVHSDSYAG